MISRTAPSPAEAATTNRWSSPLQWFGIASLYGALAVVMFWPLTARLRTGIPHDVGDPVLNTWILWWNAHATPFTAAWWSAPVFWPLRDAMALSEHLVGLTPLSTPLQWAGAGPLLTYNLVLLLSWPLSAVAAHLLAHRLTRQHGPSLVAGLVFGFNPYRLGQIPHLQVVACWWMPLALYGLHRAMDQGGARTPWRWLVLFAAAWLLQTWTNGYFFFYFSLIVGLWWLWYAARPSTWRTGFQIALAGMIAALAAAPTLLKYREVHQYWNLGRPYDVILAYSADLPSWVTAPSLLLLWPFRPEVRPEQALYPGAVAVVVILMGVAAVLIGPPRAGRGRRRAVVAGLLLASVLMVAGMTSLALGGWELSLGPLSLSVRRAGRPLTLALILLAAIAVAEPRVRGACRTRSHFAFYTLAAWLAWLMSFGPAGRLMGEAWLERPPYWWLMQLPGVAGLRVPTRFAMVAALPLAIAAALALARLTRSCGARARLAAIAVCVLAVTADSWPRPLPMPEPPGQFSVPVEARHAVVVELPLGDTVDSDVAAMYRGMTHQQPVANGYSGHVPLPYAVLAGALRERDRSALPALATLSPLCIVVDGRAARAAPSRVLALDAGARLLKVQGPFTFYLLERASRAVVEPTSAVPLRTARDGSQEAPVPALHDGREETFWESSAWQRGVETLHLELAHPAIVGGVSLVQGARPTAYPRYLVAETSEDGTTWTPAWEGQTGGLAFLAAVQDPSRVAFTIPFTTPRQATWIRLRQTGTAAGVYWAVAEVEVLLAPSR